jgi:UPF0716 protein FxsA
MIFSRLLILFVAIPLLELYILIKVGKYLGTENTILIVILTGILGAAFARSQGAGIINKIRETLNQGQIPGNEMIQGILIFAGGIMLITPGFLTDILGFSLILPYSRQIFAGFLISYIKKKIESGRVQFYQQDNDFSDPDDIWEDDSDDKPEIMQ